MNGEARSSCGDWMKAAAQSERGSTPVPANGAARRDASFLLRAIPFVAGMLDPFFGLLAEITSAVRRPALPARADSPRRRRRGLTLILGGIEGPSSYNYAMGMGLLRAGYRGAVVRFHWNAGIPIVRSAINLMSRSHHERYSDELAREIEQQFRAHPGAPISLIAQSGGCWIVVRALEKLPPDVRVHCAVLLAASISPRADLGAAAAKCARGLYSVGGPGDFFFLGVGTTVCGSSDRVFGPCIGLLGLRGTAQGLVELRWRPEWLRHGYLGNHTSSAAQRFIECVIADLIGTCRLDRRADEPLDSAPFATSHEARWC